MVTSCPRDDEIEMIPARSRSMSAGGVYLLGIDFGAADVTGLSSVCVYVRVCTGSVTLVARIATLNCIPRLSQGFFTCAWSIGYFLKEVPVLKIRELSFSTRLTLPRYLGTYLSK